jgi:hypothetical protein
MAKKKMNCVDRFYNEVISYGGIPIRRCDVYELARKAQPSWKPGSGRFGPDYQAFTPEAIDAEPWTIEEFEAYEASWEAGNPQLPARFLEEDQPSRESDDKN